MSAKEAMPVVVLNRIAKGNMTAVEGAVRLGIRKRRIFRLKAKVVREDMASLSYRNP